MIIPSRILVLFVLHPALSLGSIWCAIQIDLEVDSDSLEFHSRSLLGGHHTLKNPSDYFKGPTSSLSTMTRKQQNILNIPV